MMVPLTIICLVLLIITNIVPGECGSPPLAPALYVFGDSIVDNGNNNNFQLTLAKANYPPYGYNFVNHRPTGRFTNGRTMADFTAEYLGLPYPPPIKHLFQPRSMTGYNYASGTCGILPETGIQFGLCLSLDRQVQLFEDTVKRVLGPSLENQVTQHLAKSIFFFVAGSNDYLLNYFGALNTRKIYTPQEFAQLLINSFSQKLQKLYGIGARKVAVMNIGPLGCLPSNLKSGRYDENMNQAVSIYNDMLPSMLKNLTQTLKDLHFLLIDSYDLSYDAILNPTKYGLSDSSKSCCVTIDPIPTCIPDLLPCATPYKHFFWDRVHPTEAAYSMSASRFIHGSSPYTPMNLEQLVRL